MADFLHDFPGDGDNFSRRRSSNELRPFAGLRPRHASRVGRTLKKVPLRTQVLAGECRWFGMESTGNHGPTATERAGLTALIIDDEPHVRLFLRTALRSLGLGQIFDATNGDEGVAMYERHRPSLVLLDINMPVMPGHVALQKILGLDPEAAVIMVTSESWHETVLMFLDLGACGYVLKHGPPDGVRAALADLIDGFEVAQLAAAEG
jgi:two-component system chemotaxis response regulator CheY